MLFTNLQIPIDDVQSSNHLVPIRNLSCGGHLALVKFRSKISDIPLGDVQLGQPMGGLGPVRVDLVIVLLFQSATEGFQIGETFAR